MGADYQGQDLAIEELKALSPEAKEFLNHHINNCLASILGAARLNRHDMIEPLVWHIVSDLELAGIRKKINSAVKIISEVEGNG